MVTLTVHNAALGLALLYSGMLLLLSLGWVKGILRARNKPRPGKRADRVEDLEGPLHAGKPSVTVLVAARNEAHNISNCLQALSAQDYAGPVEVIILNDHSSDETGSTVQNWIKQLGLRHSGSANAIQFRLINFTRDEDPRGKKNVIENAIQQTDSEWIALCDADCTMGPDWLRHMIPDPKNEIAMRCGPVDIKPGSGFIANYQRSEFLGLMACGAGALTWGIPLYCNGANLAYKRREFLEIGGYRDLKKKASGDDELLLWKFVSLARKKVDFMFQKEALVHTNPVEGVGDFLRQRARWASKTGAYPRFWNLFFGGTTYAVHFMIWWFTIQWILGLEEGSLLGRLWLIKLGAEAILYFPIFYWFRSFGLLIWAPLAELFFLGYAPVIPLVGPWMKHEWKGRVQE